MITDDPIPVPNVGLDKITFYTYTGNSFELYPRKGLEISEYFSFDSITLDEDMFAESIFGTLQFFDSSNIIDQLNLSSFDELEFIIDSVVYNFRVLDVQSQTDFASKKMHGPAGIPVKTTIRFTSDEFLYRNMDVQLLQNFIGKISKTGAERNGDLTAEPSMPVSIEDEKDMDGLVQFTMRLMSGAEKNNTKAFTQDSFGWSKKPLEAHDTFNDIWVKVDPSLYPWFKLGNSLRISQLMNYVCEYACLAEDPTSVDFFFWEDLDKWNFKSVTALAADKNNFKGTYFPGLNENLENAIVSMEIISETAPAKLLSNGAFFSEYIRVKPNWVNPYRKFVDTTGNITKEHITYEYLQDIKKPRIAAFPPFTEDVLKEIRDIDFPFNTNRSTDVSYGYYNHGTYNNQNSPWWDFYNFNYDGYWGERSNRLRGINDEKTLFAKNPASAEVPRIDQDYWQAQFDFSELPGCFLLKIYKQIKWPLTNARTEYAKIKKFQKELEVYKRKICCERDVPQNFFALLVGADKIYGGDGTDFPYGKVYKEDPGGIYAYRWIEVEMWPREDVESILNTSQQIIEFEDSGFPFVFVSPKWALEGNRSEKRETKETDENGEEITVKSYTPDTRGFNLNEILNSLAPKSFENNQKTLLMGPGISTNLGISGSVDISNAVSYPNKFSMLPVGKFRIVSEYCPEQSFTGEAVISGITGNKGGFYFGGRIVQMSAIPNTSLDTIKIGNVNVVEQSEGSSEQILKPARSHLFLFDVPNSHDGLCQDCL